MTQELDGTVAVVTGASSGIGEATARRLAAAGALVALVARRADRLARLADDIRANGGRAWPVPGDLSAPGQAAAMIEQVATELGRIDILVNSAGIMLLGPVVDAPEGEWERMLRINVDGLLAATRAALPYLIAAAASSSRGVADIVSISSTAGRVARPGAAVYALSKFGLNAFSESLRQEVLGSKVRVGVVEPGTVSTELTTHLRRGIREASDRQVSAIEQLHPADIADAVHYMVTRSARVAVNEMLVRAAAQTW